MHISEASQDRARAQGRGIDPRLAARAVALASPLIESAMKEPRYGDSGFLHVVVLDPAARPGDTALEDAILYEFSFGDRSRWDADYAAFARGKAEAAWRSGADNPKGAVCLDGIVVGASGAFECFDRAYAGVVAQCLRALHALEGTAC